MVEYENVTTLYQLYADEGKYVATDALSRVFCISRHKIMAILREHKAKRIRSGVGVPVKGYYTLEDGIRLDDRIY